MIPPGLGPAASSALPPVLILCDGRRGIRLTGKPAGLHMLDVRNDCGGFLRLRSGIRLGLLLRELARMHHDKAEGLVSYPPFTVLHLHLSEHTLPMPAAWFFVLRPARFLHEEGQGGLLAPPGFECLAHGTRAGDSGDEAHPLFQT
jgi:hypothetical protein